MASNHAPYNCLCVCVCVGVDNVARLTVASFLKKKVTRLAHLFTFPSYPSNVKAKKENGWGQQQSAIPISSPMAYNTHTSRKREKALDEKSRDLEYTYRGGLLAELIIPPYCVKGSRHPQLSSIPPIFVLRKKRERNPSSSSQRRYEFSSRIGNKKSLLI